MEVDDPKTTDISSLKEAAKEIVDKSDSSEENTKNGDKATVNGTTMNGESNGNGADHEEEDEDEVDDDEDAGDEEEEEEGDDEEEVDDDEEADDGDIEEAEVEAPEPSKNGDNHDSKDDQDADSEVEAINTTPKKKSPKKGEASDEPLRRSNRKKTPTKYQDILEKEKEESSEEEIEEVEEIKDDDSDIQEIEADDPLSGSDSVTITPKNSQKKPNVVTIDDLKTLQKLATSAKQSLDKEKSDRANIIDTQSIIAGKMGSGVSITPAKPKSNSSSSNAAVNISPAGVTLGSGVTIRPNKPGVSAPGVSITPVDKTNTITTTTSGSSSASTSSSSNADPNLTDDTFVVEAPSFIVPYVYEKPPKEGIKDFKESIDKLVEEKKKEKERKKAAGEEVSDDEEKKDEDDDDSEDEEEKKKKEKEKKAQEEKEKEKSKQEAGGKENYFSSTLGKFFIDLGMNLVQEFVQKDLLREQQRRAVKDKSVAVIHAIKSLEANLEESKEKNAPFHFDLRKCKFCSFRTESRLVMQNHLETPHMRNFVYRCNFCDFETKIPQEVLFHMESEHGVKGRLERAPYYHQCPQCPFEDNAKGKLTRHKVGCDKRFKAEENQKPERDWDPPAKIRPPPVRPGGYGGYMNYSYKQGPGQIRQPGSSLMPRPNQNFQNNRFQSNQRPIAAKGTMNMRGMTPQMLASQQMLAVLNQQGLSVSGVKGLNSMMLGNNMAAKSGSVTIQSLGQKNTNKSGGSPSISITPLPGRNNPGASTKKSTSSTSSNSNSNANQMKPGQPGQGQGGKGNFVICEICDGYIKDLEQLRNHMQWIHKVKIHPKMIYNRPPLNCQKCQYRFFTDQGLERHLLGSHGLVTASMQDAANKGQDSGRCPVCGKTYQWKLLNHVAKDHGKTLKPAHLSYKCTVCTATFGQYKLFENHVYTAHSGVAKKADKSKQAAKTGGSVLKAPVKLSDEISIIPTKKDKEQNKSKEVIDLDDEEEIDDVEKEVIDVDTPKKRSTEKSDDQPEAKKAKIDN